MKKNIFLSILLLCAGFGMLNAQIKVQADGTVELGSGGAYRKTKIYPMGNIEILNNVQIGSPDDVPVYGIFRRFQVDGNVYFRVSPFQSTGPVSFHFIPFYPKISNPDPNALYDCPISLVAYDRTGMIGTSDNEMGSVYSNSYYTSGTNLGIVSASDARLKTNVRNLPSISERFSKLRPVTYNFVKSGSGEDVSKDKAYQNRTGFLAQEVKEIFPDLVVEVGGGGETIEEAMKSEKILGLDYAGLIPYLVKVIQEQNGRIEALEQQVNAIQTGAFVDEFGIDVLNSAPQQKTQSANSTENHVLHQNIPNPFNAATTINYKLAEDVTSAKICIYNLAGKQLQCHELPAAQGANTIEVRASSLQAGMYLYSLIVGNQLIDTKRMVLTE